LGEVSQIGCRRIPALPKLDVRGPSMRHRSSALISGLAGITLAALAMVVTGWLSALPAPHAVLSRFDQHSVLPFIFTSVVFIDVPIMVLSFAIGLVLFRALRRCTPALVLICAAPWLLYCGYDMVHAYSDMARLTRLGLLFSLLTWSSVFAVPVGLFLSALSLGGRPSNSQLERPRGIESS
jgi:hypothetical protein